MVEGEMKEVSEADMLEALKIAHDAIKIQCKAQMEFAEAVGSTVKRDYCHEENDEDLKKKVWDETYEKCYQVAKTLSANKHNRTEAFEAVVNEFLGSVYRRECC